MIIDRKASGKWGKEKVGWTTLYELCNDMEMEDLESGIPS
jgi:hypothetical protein